MYHVYLDGGRKASWKRLSQAKKDALFLAEMYGSNEIRIDKNAKELLTFAKNGKWAKYN